MSPYAVILKQAGGENTGTLSACLRLAEGVFLLLLLVLLGNGCATPPAQATPYAASGNPAAAPPDPGFPATAQGVSPPAGFDIDRSVAKMIRQSLKAEPALAQSSRDVRVEVSKGVVTLRGTVPSESARSQVVDQVERLPGVDGVRDEMAIR